MLAHPEMVGGNRDRLDTSLMKAVPGRIVSKGGMEALRGLGDPAPGSGPATAGRRSRATGMAIKIEDGDGYDRGTWAATIEALRQAGVLDGGPLRELARYHRPVLARPARPGRRRGDPGVRARAGRRAHRLRASPDDRLEPADPASGPPTAYRPVSDDRDRSATERSA